MSYEEVPPPARFGSVMDAIMASGIYHFSFRIVPIRFEANGEPNKHDLEQITNGT